MPGIVTSPADGEFQEEFREDWEDSMDEARRDLHDDLDNALGNDGEKVHRWRVLDAEEKELFTVTDKETVEALDDLLSGDGWDCPAEAPGDPAYTYVYSQEKTLLAGQDPEEEREYEDLLSFTVSASEDVVTMRILGGLENLSLLPGVEPEDALAFSAAVPAETAKALREPERFSE